MSSGWEEKENQEKAGFAERILDENHQATGSWSPLHTPGMNTRNVKPIPITVKLLKAKNKGTFESTQRLGDWGAWGGDALLKREIIRSTSEFLTDMRKARRQQYDTFKVSRVNICLPRTLQIVGGNINPKWRQNEDFQKNETLGNTLPETCTKRKY